MSALQFISLHSAPRSETMPNDWKECPSGFGSVVRNFRTRRDFRLIGNDCVAGNRSWKAPSEKSRSLETSAPGSETRPDSHEPIRRTTTSLDLDVFASTARRLLPLQSRRRRWRQPAEYVAADPCLYETSPLPRRRTSSLVGGIEIDVALTRARESQHHVRGISRIGLIHPDVAPGHRSDPPISALTNDTACFALSDDEARIACDRGRPDP